MSPVSPATSSPAASSPAPALWRLAVTGLAGGFLSGLFGVGGGIIMVPLLMWLAHLDQRRASATSLAAILLTSIAGTISYFVGGGEVDFLAALFVAVGSITGSWIGARLLRRLPLTVLRWGFIALLVLVALRMLFSEAERGAGPLEVTPWTAIALIGFGLFVGIASGLFGIGGGLVMVPVFVGAFGMGDLLAKGTSLAVMIPTSITGTITNLRGGLVNLRQGVVVGLAAVVASIGGAALAFVLSPEAGVWLFVALLVVVIVQLSIRAIRAQHIERKRRRLRPGNGNGNGNVGGSE